MKLRVNMYDMRTSFYTYGLPPIPNPLSRDPERVCEGHNSSRVTKKIQFGMWDPFFSYRGKEKVQGEEGVGRGGEGGQFQY